MLRHLFSSEHKPIAKVLPPEKFFEQFKPLADKTFDADKAFIDDRQREIEQLTELRKELPPDSDRLKIVDELIRENKRDIIHTELAS